MISLNITKLTFIYKNTPTLENFKKGTKCVALSLWNIQTIYSYLRSKEDGLSLGWKPRIFQKTKYNHLDFFPPPFPFHSPGKSCNFWFGFARLVIIKIILRIYATTNGVMLLLRHMGCIQIGEISNYTFSIY